MCKMKNLPKHIRKYAIDALGEWIGRNCILPNYDAPGDC